MMIQVRTITRKRNISSTEIGVKYVTTLVWSKREQKQAEGVHRGWINQRAQL